MSRSQRKTPILAMSKAESDKAYKVAEHRRERHHTRQRLHVSADDTDRRLHRPFGNPACAPKDGKQYFPGSPRDMRK